MCSVSGPAEFKDHEEIEGIPPIIVIVGKILQQIYNYYIIIHSFPNFYSIKNYKIIKQDFWLAKPEVFQCFCHSGCNPSPKQKYLTCSLSSQRQMCGSPFRLWNH